MLARAPVAVVTAAAALAVVGSQAAGAAPRRATVIPPQAHPHGRSYSEWAASWWQWVLTQPVESNPVLDPTGANCARGQAGRVWFLAGSFESGPVTRECTVPAGTMLFFPIVNFVSCAFLTDPPEQRTEEYLRSQNEFVRDNARDLSASVDGRPVRNLQARYFEESTLFDLVLPAGNIFGLDPGFVLEPCADAGYYLMLPPLPPGEHTIRFSGLLDTFSVDVTYELVVARRAP